MRYLTKLAGGVVLGSAALLLAAPATALAADGEPKDPKGSDHWQESKETSDHKRKTFDAKDKEGNGLTCAANQQSNEQNITQIIKDNIIKDSVVVLHLDASQTATNEIRTQPNNNTIVVCIRDLEVDVDVKNDLVNDLVRMVEAGIGQAPASKPGGNASALGGAFVGPDGTWVLPKTAGVAAGDGGAFSDTNTGALTAAGAGLMGAGVLGGLALLRRRSANGTAA